MQINTVTRDQVTDYWKQSRVAGTDLGEVLDRAGVLLTPERLATIRAICLEHVAQVLEQTPTSWYTQGYQVSAADLQAHIARVVRTQANEERARSTR